MTSASARQDNGSDLYELLKTAQRLARDKHRISNILQPGIIKELMIAEILGHELVPQKDSSDARDAQGNVYEYLASIRRVGKRSDSCNFQMDRLTRDNLYRITRNHCFYFGIFRDHLEVEEIWRVDTSILLHETLRQLESSKNDIAHLNLSLKWLQAHGCCVYPYTH